MNLKQEYFALQYVKTAGDIAASTEAMGITPSLGKRYLRNEEVKGYISKLNGDVEKVVGINKAVIVQKVLDLHDDALADEKKDRSTARACLADVSKMLGYNDAIKISSEETVRIIAMPAEKELIEAEIINFDKETR